MIAARYTTKKLLKEAVGKELAYQETSIMGNEYKSSGSFPVVGPSATKRIWYATVTMADDKIKSVK